MLGFLVVALAAPGPTLFFLEPSPDGPCAARAMDVANRSSRVLFEAPECPQHVLFSEARDRVIYTAKGTVWIRPLSDTQARPTALGALPAGGVERLFVMKTTRNLRALALVRLDDGAEVRRGSRTVFRFEEKSLDASGLMEPGLPAVAVLLELDGKGAWRRLKVAPTRTGAGESPGVSVLEPGERAPDVLSLDALLRRQWCVGGLLDCDVDTPSLLKLTGAGERDSVGLTPEGTPRLGFRVGFGDTPHAVPPVFLCEAGCEKGKPLTVSPEQLGIEVSGGYALVTEEYSGNAPVVFDAKGKQVVSLPAARAAVWLPIGSGEPAGSAGPAPGP
jgi:hypothetical protein